MNPIVKDPLTKKIDSNNWILLAVIFLPALIFMPIKFSLGILIGGFISIVNFHWMKRGLSGIFNNAAGTAKRRLLVKYYIRLAITAVVLFFLISNKTVDVIGLIIGLSVVVLNIVLTTINTLAKKNSCEEVV